MPKDMDEEDFELLDRKVLGAIRLDLTNQVAFNVKDQQTARDLMKTLSNLYEHPFARDLVKKLSNLKMTEAVFMLTQFSRKLEDDKSVNCQLIRERKVELPTGCEHDRDQRNQIA
ncbi:hypothetical protein Dsin_032354 [Dipteronia sinensis]|uniref:Uncharacterized protein n=1 Tax=Dipteronia sinensis TaxID=43782 RepID=A0AAD9ZNL9_9ROSI|nr:hypothetical protein Dsin_032354 [Dipteronia sinensis]